MTNPEDINYSSSSSSSSSHQQMAVETPSTSSSTTTTTTTTTSSSSEPNQNMMVQEKKHKSKDHWKRMLQELLDKADIKINGNREWDVTVHNESFYKRVFAEGSLGLGESYMDGWWDCPRMDILFTKIFRAELNHQLPKNLGDLFRIASNRLFNHQSRKRAWIVGKEHYDLGNDLFTQMLDPHMQYSCGYWKTATNLNQAQEDKLRLICEKLMLQPGMTLLDIGCGWGGLAYFAAKNYGVSVVGVTISAEQQKLAQDRCIGLDVTIELVDYRDLHRQFDRIVSVGMFEHVGSKNYRTYFEVARRNIKPDGVFLLHCLGVNTTKITNDAWIEKYIFPNGICPSVASITSSSEDYFVVEDVHNFGPDYDKTLLAWYANFLEAYPKLDQQKYNARFKRMWTYYLNACAGGFRGRTLQLWQFLLSPHGIEGGVRVPR
ncbi:hypothetical protein DFA_09771 [Cavenderia fasciculata]|uniref:Cyclopropane fatty acyl phospholipid synthase n=1 Tax=Cavenderia fasciculata TaxID=261658 RepID=F4Q8J9_CACFS|nr:uncharacterized protein DFA_09771 [Cavenderia fasciculata]EGG16099.1 hypothetical protein DFA_09771 [Cavenderia fasciculata]|eukprot:XP_004352424.1 hypothetical protein DFA_09771 [Cavenderia fasciculata]